MSSVEVLDCTGRTSARSYVHLDAVTVLPSTCYIFSEEDQFNQDRGALASIVGKAMSPTLLQTGLIQHSNGFYAMQPLPCGEDDPRECHLLFRCQIKLLSSNWHRDEKYDWITTSIVGAWTSEHAQLACFGVPTDARDGVELAIRNDNRDRNVCQHPLALLLPVLTEITTLYDKSVWRIRDGLRHFEIVRNTSAAYEPDFALMHELARHAIHVTETLTATGKSISSTRDELITFRRELLHPRDASDMRLLVSLFGSLKDRSESNEKRLQNEITLAFNTIAQRDSKVMVAVGNATQLDSTAMRTIALVTMVFLPATFTSGSHHFALDAAIFSTSFFNFTPATEGKPEHWRVSDKFWVFWMVAALLTAATLAASAMIGQMRQRKRDQIH